jgi:hypothetical protein
MILTIALALTLSMDLGAAKKKAKPAKPPPAKAETATPPAKAEPAAPAKVEAAALKGHATIGGLGPVKQIAVFNDSDDKWTNCDLRLPTNQHYALKELTAKDQERVFLHMFKQDGVELDRPLDAITVKCDQGSVRLPFDL